MINRIRAAWSVLRGTHQAVPVAAKWFYGNHFTTYSGTTSTQPLYFDFTGGK